PDAPADHSAALLPDAPAPIATSTSSPQSTEAPKSLSDSPAKPMSASASFGSSPELPPRTIAATGIALPLSGAEISPVGRREAASIVSVSKSDDIAPMVNPAAESFPEPV